MSNDEQITRRVRVARVPRDQCPLAAAAEAFGERWTLLVLREIFYGVDRFDDICADLDIPRATLSKRLDTLVEIGLVATREYREPGRRKRSAYTLTGSGRQFTTTLWALTEWSETHLFSGRAPARLVHAETGAPLSVSFTDDAGNIIDLEDTAWRIDT